MTTSVLDSRSGSCRRSTVAVMTGALGSCAGLQRAHADQVIRRRREEKLPIHAGTPAMPELAESTDGLHPAEDFFDAFAHTLADGVARVPRGPSVQRATLLRERDVRRDLEVPQRVDKAARVIAFVAADGDPSWRQRRDQADGRLAFARAGRRGDAGVDHEPVTVLHQDFAEIDQLGFVAFRLLEQPAVGIGRRLMGLIRPPFPMKIDRRIPGVVWRFTGLILPCETLE